jgi:hypothetical protein
LHGAIYPDSIPTVYTGFGKVRERRIIQYKMILKQNLIPMQDDPENGRNGVGKPLGNADQNAECRESDTFTNQRVLEGQRGDRVQRAKPWRGLRLGRKDACPAGVSSATEEAARRDPNVFEQDRRTEHGADYAADSGARSDRKSGSPAYFRYDSLAIPQPRSS